MTDFTDFEVSVEDDEVSNNDLDSLKSFIDDNDGIENSRTFYQKFENVTIFTDDALKEGYGKIIVDIQKIDVSNVCKTSEEGIDVETDEFKVTEKTKEKVKETLFPVSTDNDDDGNNYNSFVNALFFAIRFNIEQKTDLRSSDELNESVDNNLFIQLNQEKFNMILDYQKFNNQCHEVNMLLAKHGYFLRVFELKDKFHHLALRHSKKQNIFRQLFSSKNEKYNGFHAISIEYSKKLRKKIKPIIINYKPVKPPEIKSQSYYSQDISKSYRNSCRDTKKLLQML